MEAIFFLSYFLLFPLFTDIEFNLREPGGDPAGVSGVLPYRIVSGLLYMLPYLVYYKLLLQKYLFSKRFVAFWALLLLFLLLFNIYTPAVNWLIAEMNFPAVKLRSAIGIDFQKAVSLNFSLMYILRELLVITALAYFIRSAKQESEMQELKQQQLSTELNYLKVRLHPHFFFNTLNNIYSLTLQESDKAAALVAKHSDIMRYILYETSGPLVKLRQETGFLKNFTEVEAMRYPDRIRITFDCQGISDTAVIEPLLLLPFVENTFKHGISEETDEGYVHIIISQVDDELSAEIRNSKSRRRETRVLQEGIGLENAKKRLKILYPGRHTLEIHEDDSSYEVRLSLKLAVS